MQVVYKIVHKIMLKKLSHSITLIFHSQCISLNKGEKYEKSNHYLSFFICAYNQPVVLTKKQTIHLFEEAKKHTDAPTIIEFMISTDELVLPMVKGGNPMSEMILK